MSQEPAPERTWEKAIKAEGPVDFSRRSPGFAEGKPPLKVAPSPPREEKVAESSPQITTGSPESQEAGVHPFAAEDVEWVKFFRKFKKIIEGPPVPEEEKPPLHTCSEAILETALNLLELKQAKSLSMGTMKIDSYGIISLLQRALAKKYELKPSKIQEHLVTVEQCATVVENLSMALKPEAEEWKEGTDMSPDLNEFTTQVRGLLEACNVSWDALELQIAVNDIREKATSEASAGKSE